MRSALEKSAAPELRSDKSTVNVMQTIRENNFVNIHNVKFPAINYEYLYKSTII